MVRGEEQYWSKEQLDEVEENGGLLPGEKLPMYQLNDDGMAELFAKMYFGRAIWNQDTGKWHLWTGSQWKEAGAQTYVRRLVTHALKIYPKLLEDGVPEDYVIKLRKFLRDCSNSARKSAILFEARCMEGIVYPSSEFDTQEYLVNCENGTVDLKVGYMRRHKPVDMLSHQAPCRYVKDADIKDDILQRYLWGVSCGDKEWIDFLQLAAGYTLTGSVEEEVFFFLSGETATGKSTLYEAMLKTVGTYGMQANFKSFLESQKGESTLQRDITRMVGKRLVLAEESDKKTRLAVGMVKWLTGGSTVTARRLYHEGFDFDPNFTLWLSSNYRPVVDHADNAIWRRLIHIPFLHKMSIKEMDPRIKHHLTRTQEGREAVFAWMVRGAMRWYEMRKKSPGKMVWQAAIPKSISGATQAYRDEMSVIKGFLSESGIDKVTKPMVRTVVWRQYEAYAKENKEKVVLTLREFTTEMRSAGYVDKTVHMVLGSVGEKKAYACWVSPPKEESERL